MFEFHFHVTAEEEEFSNFSFSMDEQFFFSFFKRHFHSFVASWAVVESKKSINIKKWEEKKSWYQSRVKKVSTGRHPFVESAQVSVNQKRVIW